MVQRRDVDSGWKMIKIIGFIITVAHADPAADHQQRQQVLRLCVGQIQAQYQREMKELPGPADPDYQFRLNACIKALGLNP